MFKGFFKIIILVVSVFMLGMVYYAVTAPEELPVINSSEYEAESFAIYTGDGDIILADKIKEIKKSLFGGSTVKTDTLTIKKPVGIIENPPSASITDIKDIVLELVDKDRKVLLIYIDGIEATGTVLFASEQKQKEPSPLLIFTTHLFSEKLQSI